MKSYGQYCAVARGLDVVGDRWTLLIVRELLDGGRRYGEQKRGLPGIATNLLGDRLKVLVEAGVVEHDGERYGLTPWGEGLREVIYAIGRWGTPLMARPSGDDEFHVDWLRHLLAMHDITPAETTEVRIGDEALIVGEGEPEAVVSGTPDEVGRRLLGLPADA